MQELPWGYRPKRKTTFKAVGKDDDELVHGLSCKEKSNQRLFGMPRLRNGIMEYWSTGVLEQFVIKIDPFC